MRKMIKIAENELRTLFYSPVAWFVLLIFVIQVSIDFTSLIQSTLSYRSLGNEISYSITQNLLTGFSGLFITIQGNLYLYIPLLTMGLISRELSSGSVKLLYSSPVNATQIILGKYISVMIYGLIMIFVVALFLLFAWAVIPFFDTGQAISGLLGLYLLICAYGAIGLYMSSLTSYQIVAAMGTLLVLTILNFIGGIGQGIDFIRDITYWLSLKGRVMIFLDGLFCSEEFLYFILVIALFVTLSVMKVEGRRSKRSPFITGIRYFSVVAAVILLGYVTSRPSIRLYADLTNARTQTLSEESQRIVKEIKDPLTFTAYVNILGMNYIYGLPNKVNSNRTFFRSFIRYKPDLKLDYVYYYKKTREYSGRLAGLSDEEIVKEILKNSKVTIKNIVPLENLGEQKEVAEEGYSFFWKVKRENGKATHLRLFQDMLVFPTEQEISAALKRLTTKAPLIAFLGGHGERDINSVADKDYYSFTGNQEFRYSLLNQGFDLMTFQMSEGEIPEDIDILVVAELRSDLSEDELGKIRRFAERGGNLLIAGEPGREKFLNPLLNLFGITYREGKLIQPNGDYDADLIVCEFAGEAAGLSKELARLEKGKTQITMPGASGLIAERVNGYQVTPLLSTIDSVYLSLPGEEFPGNRKRIHTAIAMEKNISGNSSQKMIILGDADCFSNAELMMQREGIKSDNLSLITESFRWLADGEFPVDTYRPEPKDTQINLKLTNMTGIKWLFTGLFPLLLLAGFLIVQRRRRRR